MSMRSRQHGPDRKVGVGEIGRLDDLGADVLFGRCAGDGLDEFGKEQIVRVRASAGQAAGFACGRSSDADVDELSSVEAGELLLDEAARTRLRQVRKRP